VSATELLGHQLRPARGKPDGALVLLHGRGTNQFDLLPLLDELDPERRLVGVTPRAPLDQLRVLGLTRPRALDAERARGIES
jgi:predicted esterase